MGQVSSFLEGGNRLALVDKPKSIPILFRGQISSVAIGEAVDGAVAVSGFIEGLVLIDVRAFNKIHEDLIHVHDDQQEFGQGEACSHERENGIGS